MIETEIQKSFKFTKSPSYLILIIILINILFWLVYILILLISDMFDTFWSGTFINLWYDTLLLVSIIIIQNIIYFIMIWRRYTENYIVSKNEIKHKKWIFVKEEEDYSLKNIVSIETKKSFWGNILNYWDVIISYTNIGQNKVTIKNISNPEYFISLIKE